MVNPFFTFFYIFFLIKHPYRKLLGNLLYLAPADIRNPLCHVSLHRITSSQFIRRSLHFSQSVFEKCFLQMDAGNSPGLAKNIHKDKNKNVFIIKIRKERILPNRL